MQQSLHFIDRVLNVMDLFVKMLETVIMGIEQQHQTNLELIES